MNLSDWLHILELASVSCVVIATIWVMQHQLTRAHILLRIGLALVCGGSIMEFYCALQDTHQGTHSITSLVENLGQAAVYIWAATSKRLWRVMDRIGRMEAGKPL